MEEVLKLMNEKDMIESKIKTLGEILVKNSNVGMNSPLVDSDGFPRADIDVYQVRHARHNIICLQNDHKALMKKIEKGLEMIHENSATLLIDPNGINAPTPTEDMIAFALINKIDTGSPAEIDGLQENDHVCKFGSVIAENFQSLSMVGEVVQRSKNKPIQVIVRRDKKEKIVVLTPRTWAGRGLLGCNIIPLESAER